MIWTVVILLIFAISNAIFLILGVKIGKKEPILPEIDKFREEDFTIYEPDEMVTKLQTNKNGKILTENDEWPEA